jgi:hypothetical protein
MSNQVKSSLPNADSDESIPVMVVRRSTEDWCKSSIASLSALQISRMSDHTLVELISLVQLYLPQSIVCHRLRLCDRPTLERLAFLARRICRNQGY